MPSLFSSSMILMLWHQRGLMLKMFEYDIGVVASKRIDVGKTTIKFANSSSAPLPTQKVLRSPGSIVIITCILYPFDFTKTKLEIWR